MLVLVPIVVFMLFARYGNEKAESFTNGEVAVVRQFYDVALPNSLVYTGISTGPVRYRDYDLYSFRSIQELPEWTTTSTSTGQLKPLIDDIYKTMAARPGGAAYVMILRSQEAFADIFSGQPPGTLAKLADAPLERRPLPACSTRCRTASCSGSPARRGWRMTQMNRFVLPASGRGRRDRRTVLDVLRHPLAAARDPAVLFVVLGPARLDRDGATADTVTEITAAIGLSLTAAVHDHDRPDLHRHVVADADARLPGLADVRRRAPAARAAVRARRARPRLAALRAPPARARGLAARAA